MRYVGNVCVMVSLILATFDNVMAWDGENTPDESQIRAWVEALANRGPKRRFKGPSDRLRPQEIEDLKPVIAAHKQLTRHFIVALPILIESLGDTRYSYPREHPSSAAFEPQSVGDACHNLINRKLLLQNPVVEDSRLIAVWRSLPVSKTWYSRAKGKSLFELQVESLDWLISQPPPKHVKADRWDPEIKHVRTFREEFVREGRPLDEVFGPPIEGK